MREKQTLANDKCIYFLCIKRKANVNVKEDDNNKLVHLEELEMSDWMLASGAGLRVICNIKVID